MVTPKSNFNVTLGNTYSYQNFNSYIFQMLDNGFRNDLNSAVDSNQVTYNFNDAFVGLHYKMLLGKVTITPGFSQHFYNMKNQPSPPKTYHFILEKDDSYDCLLYTSPSPRDGLLSRMPSSA